jgi:hypothetical protein
MREMLKNLGTTLMGVVEIDETYMARKYASDYKGLSQEEIKYINTHNSSQRDKGVAVEMSERGGKIKVLEISENKAIAIRELVNKHIEEGSRLLTDESYI